MLGSHRPKEHTQTHGTRPTTRHKTGLDKVTPERGRESQGWASLAYRSHTTSGRPGSPVQARPVCALDTCNARPHSFAVQSDEQNDEESLLFFRWTLPVGVAAAGAPPVSDRAVVEHQLDCAADDAVRRTDEL